MIEITEWADKLTAVLTGQLKLWAGLAVSVSTALLMSSDALPDGPARHTVLVVSIVATAIYGFLLRQPK